MTNCIEIKGLAKEYKTFTLGPIDLTVPGGSILGLIGENGAGKTTLIKSILGITNTSGGTVTLLGTDPDHAKEDVGVVMDDCFFSEYLRVKDVNSVLSRVYKGWDTGLFRDYLDKFGLAGTKNIKELSRGMRMKLSLAAALAHRPKLLLLDEATAGLDPVVRDEILDEFLRREGPPAGELWTAGVRQSGPGPGGQGLHRLHPEEPVFHRGADPAQERL